MDWLMILLPFAVVAVAFLMAWVYNMIEGK
jgi:hypothetical protein